MKEEDFILILSEEMEKTEYWKDISLFPPKDKFPPELEKAILESMKRAYETGNAHANLVDALAKEHPLNNDNAEQVAATNAIRREYGRVIGEGQAHNIAYTALVAARGAWFDRMRK